jgi:hypothetical protein
MFALRRQQGSLLVNLGGHNEEKEGNNAPICGTAADMYFQRGHYLSEWSVLTWF